MSLLDNLADDVTMEGSVLTGIAEGPEAIRAILGFARTLYEYQEFNYVGPTETTGSSRTTRRWCGVNRSAASW